MAEHRAGSAGGELPALAMSDDAFLATFQRGEFAGDAFPHRAHLRMAWLYVTALGPELAVQRAAAGIRNLARHNGRPGLYHDTLTRAWLYVVAATLTHRQTATFDEFIAHNPGLLDKQLLLRHYSPEVLFSAQARAAWIAPDLRPIPGAPSSSA